jgi:DNA modification methylase
MLELNKITIGDSFGILPTLPDKIAQLILTDVPYDLNQDQKHFLHTQFRRLASRCIIVFSPPENQWIFPDINEYLFWIKPISTKNTSRHYSRFVEMMFVYHQEDAVWNCSRHWSQYTNVFMDLVDNSKKHPFRKPPALLERLILNHSLENDIVLDPFSGSGSVFEVCKKTNRQFIGVEIEENFSWTGT